MSSNRRIRRDDFDIESIETFHDHKSHNSRSSASRTRSRSRKRSYSRRIGNVSRSRSRSLERKRHRRGHDSYSRSRSGSHSHDYNRPSGKRNQVSKRCRASRSRSNSRSRSRCRSRSQSYSSRHHSDRYDYKCDDYNDRMIKNSRSRSSSSSHFRDCKNKSANQSVGKSSRSTSSRSIQYDKNDTDTCQNLEDLPLPKQKPDGIYNFDEDEQIDIERIHREMEEKLRATLAKEGKVYPPPKPEASHPVFANDGSFLEIFKKMQEAQSSTSSAAIVTPVTNIKPSFPSVPPIVATASPATAPYLAAAAAGKTAPPPPVVGRRRGGKILKTGVVAKRKVQTDSNADPKDFWSLYLAEVNKYKNTACESEQGNRPLVK